MNSRNPFPPPEDEFSKIKKSINKVLNENGGTNLSSRQLFLYEKDLLHAKHKLQEALHKQAVAVEEDRQEKRIHGIQIGRLIMISYLTLTRKAI